jgi:FAD/FMN-containing dehydrogenase
MIEVNAEDQYAIVAGSATLTQLEDALPSNLHYRAPRIDLSIEDWILSGGIGILNAPPTRKEVLGLEYTGAHGTIQVGGRVVKNVAGYDAVRLIVGSDAALKKGVRIERATLRLRPKPRIVRLENVVQESDLVRELETLKSLGAMFGFAHLLENAWRVRAEFWGTASDWGSEASDKTGAELRDLQGVFPRPAESRSGLESLVLNAL